MQEANLAAKKVYSVSNCREGGPNPRQQLMPEHRGNVAWDIHLDSLSVSQFESVLLKKRLSFKSSITW